jgi:branched-subunit amino acid transport protein
VTVWVAIAGAGIATFLTRSLPLVATFRPSARLRSYLEDLPTSIIAALAGAGILAPDQRFAFGPEVIATPVVIALAWWRRNLLLAVLAGVLVVALVRRSIA